MRTRQDRRFGTPTHSRRLALAVLGLAVLALPAAGGPPATFEYSEPCAKGDRLTIVAVGDLLFHKRLQMQALSKGGDYRAFFTPLADVLAKADLAYGNLEGPAAGGVARGGRAVKDPGRKLDGLVYGSELKSLNFNYHPSVVADLKAVGFDVLSTANNHAYDRGPLGIDRTIDAMVEAGMPFTGTRKRDEYDRTWSVITEAKGFRVAWLACTFSLNGFADRYHQALDCWKDTSLLLGEVIRLASDPAIDAVILVPHWGVEGSRIPEQRAKLLARTAIDMGATAVIGTHPHVLQPWERYVAPDGRESLIVYSTGNFVSNQRRIEQRSGVVVVLELLRETGKRARIGAAGHIPTWVVIDGRGHRVIENRGGPGIGGALASSLKLLPPGNRIDASAVGHPIARCPA